MSFSLGARSIAFQANISIRAAYLCICFTLFKFTAPARLPQSHLASVSLRRRVSQHFTFNWKPNRTLCFATCRGASVWVNCIDGEVERCWSLSVCKCTDELVNIHKLDRLDGRGSPLYDHASRQSLTGFCCFW